MEKSTKSSPDLREARTERTPIKISTKNVCLGIFDLQYRHRPFKNKKENMG